MLYIFRLQEGIQLCSALLEKLISLQFNAHLVNWISNYLTNRFQRVVVDGETSSAAMVLSGVPQGSIIGPLLFLIYVDGVTTIPFSRGSASSLYADDLMLYKSISSPADIAAVQQDIVAIEQWSSDNHLTLNTSKCKYMIISRKRGSSQHKYAPLTLNGQPLELVDSFKYLGVTLSSDLSWSLHTNIICNKARKILGLIYRRFYLDSSPATLLNLYTSLVRPIVEYASQVWSHYTACDIARIESVQKFALRMASHNWSLVTMICFLSSVFHPLRGEDMRHV